MNQKKIILFLGASITQGRISKNYIKILKVKLGTKQYKYLNHGVAGYESFNVLNKLDKAIQVKPDYVVLLVGTNDVLSSLDPKLAKLSRKLKHIPHKPTLLNYCVNIASIVKRLKKETDSKIAILSLPVIGENLNSLENNTIAEYNAELFRIAKKDSIAYLPVNENFKKILIKNVEGRGKDYINGTKMVFKSMVLHYLLLNSLDSISRKNGFLLLTDGVHLNSTGAKIVADEIEGFIRD
jgi:lysophospholipase L1-like esterase